MERWRKEKKKAGEERSKDDGETGNFPMPSWPLRYFFLNTVPTFFFPFSLSPFPPLFLRLFFLASN